MSHKHAYLSWVFAMEIPTWNGLTSFCKYHLGQPLKKINLFRIKSSVQSVAELRICGWIYNLSAETKSRFKQRSSFLRLGYRVVSGTVYFCIDDVLDKFYCVIGDSMNLCRETQGYVQKQLNTLTQPYSNPNNLNASFTHIRSIAKESTVEIFPFQIKGVRIKGFLQEKLVILGYIN